MHYPLREKIGKPELLVGREKEFKFFQDWIDNIPHELSKSRVILARRKSGKTAFVQRLFNQLWSANGQVIPFYYHASENKAWYRDFAIEYYCTFASQYISFLERDEQLVREHLTLDEIKAYGQQHGIRSLVRDVDFIHQQIDLKGHDSLWKRVYRAPHRFASVYDVRFLIIIDEFQYLSNTIYPDPNYHYDVNETIPASFHEVVESKVAPMLVTGSYISWLIQIASRYLEAGRLSRWWLSPYLTEEEGLEAVYRYADVYRQPITTETAHQINQLCQSDPFFISCVVQSFYPDKRLDTEEGVIHTVNYEVTSYESELSMMWGEYIERTLPKINDRHSKQILLHMSKHNDEEWTPERLQTELGLVDMSVNEIHAKLHLLVEADLLVRGSSDIRYRGLQDGTLYLVLRHRFEDEIMTQTPNFPRDFAQELKSLKKEHQRLQGQFSNLIGRLAESQLAAKFRSHKRFALSGYFRGAADQTRLNIIDVQTRLMQTRPDGKVQELDVVARSSDQRVVLVEVKKWQQKIGPTVVEDFYEKVAAYRANHPQAIVLPAILSLGGFSEPAQTLCETHGIGMAETIVWEANWGNT